MKAKAKPVNTQPTLLVDSEVVRQIRQHARSSSKNEICGVLIGQDRDRRIEVAACIEGQNAEEAGAHVTFTQDTWEHIYAVKDKRYPEERIVGWYHSHPGFGVFLSDHDTFIHKNFFSSPGQVAWVFDPHSDEEGCFGWVDGRIERLTRIAVVDRRGGEQAEESGRPEPVAAAGAETELAVVRGEGRESRPLRIRRLDADREGSASEWSLERLVANVFLSLLTLALGFALSWYLFPRVEIVPVMLDARTGQLIDARTGEVIAEPRDTKSGSAERGDPNGPPNPNVLDPNKPSPPSSSKPSSSSPSSSNPGAQKKRDNAKP
jgi:proteasome lid subunit RPN8/RPN11